MSKRLLEVKVNDDTTFVVEEYVPDHFELGFIDDLGENWPSDSLTVEDILRLGNELVNLANSIKSQKLLQ